MVTDPERAAPIIAIWQRYTEWLRDYMPMAYANLAPGATDKELAEVAADVGHDLPADVQALLRLNNGQRETALAATANPPESAVAVLPDTNLLSTECVVKEWSRWRAVVREAEGVKDGEYEDIGASLAPSRVKPLYCNRHWVPLFNAELQSDYLGLDFDPGPDGVPGQLINFGRDEKSHYVAAADLTGLLRLLTEEVMAAGPAEPKPPVPPVAVGSEDAEGEDWYYWGDYQHAFETAYHHHHPAGRRKPTALRWADWPSRERSS